METILQGLMELSGVTAAMVLDGAGRVVAHRGRAVYDRSTCEQAGGTLQKAIESLQLQQEDWDAVTAQYADGKILLRRLVAASGAGRRHVLVVVADPTLNASFATVAIRVAANKLKAALEGGAPDLAASAGPTASSAAPPPPAPSVAAAASAPPAPAAPPALSQAEPPVLAYNGLSWSKASSAATSSAAGVSGVQAADAASSALLSRVAKELARHVGPMAKVYVQEGVRRVSPEGPFSLSSRRALVADLAGQIEDPADRAQFVKALEKA
jgi:predicted regulator of Ras-like GTPase activity (Roadblock/LC7/MglB family)